MAGCAQAHAPGGLHEPDPTLPEDREEGNGTSQAFSVGAPSIPFPVAWKVMKGFLSKLICARLIANRSSVTEEPQVIGRRLRDAASLAKSHLCEKGAPF